MKTYYITENDYPIEKPPIEDFIGGSEFDDTIIKLNNYMVRIYTAPTSLYDEVIILQIGIHESCGHNIITFELDYLTKITYCHDKEKGELYIILDNNLFVFRDVYTNRSIEEDINNLIKMMDNQDRDNKFLKIMLCNGLCIEDMSYEDKFKMIYRSLEKEKDHMYLNIDDANKINMSQCYNKYKFESLTNLINICNEQCTCKKKSIKINKCDNKIIIHTCCSNKTFVLKSVEHNFKNPKLGKLCDIAIKTCK